MRWLMMIAGILVGLLVLGWIIHLVLWGIGAALVVGVLWYAWRLWPRHPWIAGGLVALMLVALGRLVLGLWLSLWPWLLAAVVLIGLWDLWQRGGGSQRRHA
jgi:hypothetical protein